MTETLVDLRKKVSLAQTDWLKLKLDLKMGKLKNIQELGQKRKEIARLKTLIREKETTKIIN